MKKLIFPILLIIVFLAGQNNAQTNGKKFDIKNIFSIDSTYSPGPASKDTIEMSIGALKDYGGGQNVVELEPKYENSDYVLPIVIGICEMRGIYSKKNGEVSPRPMTYDLMTTILQQTGVKLDKIIINNLTGGTYYAVLVIIQNNKKIEIDSRPSDAINLAMRSNAPVYALRKVFDEAKELKTK